MAEKYRYDKACEFQSKLKNIIDIYTEKVKKYRRRIIFIDTVLYSASAIIAGAGVVLSTLTMTSPVIITIIVSTSTTIAGVFNIIMKR